VNVISPRQPIARFGSLYEEWRTVLFELVFRPPVAKTGVVKT
jgi:hypothetical protein